jgi:TonB family protein
MLVEPERYSAWTLYAEILDADPENAAATTGLYEVADALVERATTAFEQGRFGDAEATVEHVLAELPAHDGAMQLSIAITEQQRSAAARERQQLADAAVEASPAALQAAVVAPAASDLRASAFPGVGAPAPTPLDPVLDLRAAFDDAIAADALVQPEEQNAKYFLNRMLDLDAEHARTVEAHELLFTTFLSRAATATVGLDEIAAETWIAEAEKLDADDARIGQARNDLLENLVMAESAKPVPAAQLTIVEYTSPRYPTAAANRNLEGWVDLEFVVTTDGRTEDVSVVDASHREYFRDEAVAAVEGWRFEPRTFHDRPIEQAAYTRIRFALE